MSFEVATVVELGDAPPDAGWLQTLRHRFRSVDTLVLTSRDGSVPGSVAATELADQPEIAHAQYVWFVPQGADPAPHTLDLLLESLTSAETLGAVGPKLVRPGTQEILSAGVTTTRSGHRLNPVSPREVDAGQYDRTEDVLALDMPGLLVDAELVRRLGPPADVLDDAHRGLEYSRRIRSAGRRVQLCHRARVAVPVSVVADLGTSARPITSATRLRGEHRYRLSVVTGSRLPALLVLLVLQCLAGAVSGLLANDPARAGWFLRALLALPTDSRLTRHVRATGSGRDPDVGLFATAGDLAVVRRGLRRRDPSGYSEGVPGPDAAFTEDEDVFVDTEGDVGGYARLRTRSRGVLSHPLTAVLVALSVATLVQFVRLVGPGSISGGALPHTDVGLAEIWRRVFVPVDPSGLGQAVPADPLLTVIGLLSTLFLGHTDLALRVLWALALPLSAVLAYLCAGKVVPASGPRALLALVWACSPAHLLAAQQGRLGTLVVWLAVPVAVLALVRAAEARSGSRRAAAAAGAGLALALVGAGAPLLVVPCLLAVVLLTLFARRPGLLWALVAPLGLLGPWLWGVLREPDALLTSPGLVVDAALTGLQAPRSWEVALGFPVRTGDLALAGLLPEAVAGWILLLLALPLLVTAALALLRVVGSLLVLGISVLAYVLGLCGGIAQAATESGLTATGLVASWSGDSAALLTLGACGMVAAAVWPVRDDRSGRLRNRFVRSAVPAAALAVLGVFVAQSVLTSVPVRASDASRLPTFASERAVGEHRQRTLVVWETDGQVTGRLEDPSTGSLVATSTLAQARAVEGGPFDRRPVDIDPADRALATALGRLTSGDGVDARDALRELAVGFVVVQSPPTADDPEGTRRAGASAADGEDPDPAIEALARTVGVSPGLTRLGDTDRGALWQVSVEDGAAPSSRAQVIDLAGQMTPLTYSDPIGARTSAELPALTEDQQRAADEEEVLAEDEGRDRRPARVLALSERPGLTRVTLAGEPLEEITDEQVLADLPGDWRAYYALPAEGATGSGGLLEMSTVRPGYVVAASLGLGGVLVAILCALPLGRRRVREDLREPVPDTLTLPVVEEPGRPNPETSRMMVFARMVKNPANARSIVTFACIALPGVLIATTGFLTPLAAGDVARAAEQVRLPATRTVSVCPGPFHVAEEAEGTDEDFRASDAPEISVQNVSAVTGAPDGSTAAAGVRATALEGGEYYRTGASNGFVSGDDVVATPVVVAGEPEGESPALVSAVQTVAVDDGDFTGLATPTCTRPTTHAVFAGTNTMIGTDSRLVLSNPGDSPVTVTPRLSGPSGPLGVLGQDAVSVPAHGQRAVLLGSLAGIQDVVGVEVEAAGGLVSATIQQTRLDGLTPRGIEYVEPAAAAARTTRVPLAEGGRATVHVHNPTGTTVEADIRVVGEAGAVETDQDFLALPAGATGEVEIGEVPAGTVEITSEHALQASVSVSRDFAPDAEEDTEDAGATDDEDAYSDVATVSAPAGLRDSQLVSLPRDAESAFLLSPGSGTVRVSGIREDGSVIGQRDVQVSADRSTRIVPDDLFGERVYALRLDTAEDSRVVAAGTALNGAGISGLQIPAAPIGVGYRSIRIAP
ncbi:DUF5719 family protein [Brevibacterium litoralis]|uniref:DUF5719 family protein n=1 Tax=Brevibacterium litoralis TaxID=3138935 RepID=UPI0032EEAD2D